MPAFLAFSTSSGVSWGERYNVIRNLTLGSIRSSRSLYVIAISVVVTGGVKLGLMSASCLGEKLPSQLRRILHPVALSAQLVSSDRPVVDVP